jgi:CubicO group peptidase (beta-lactamase class C family)
MTVAVSKQGRLIHTKGYGFALFDGGTKVPMQASMRSRIGSSSKATVTGPAAYQLLAEHGIDPVNQTLYGPDGFFEGKFDADIQERIDELTPDSLDQLAGQSINWADWYSKITIQHMFDHATGFDGGGDGKGAAEMFNVAEEDVTYEMIHRHFLRTRTLLFEPGTDTDYSNHGFGLFTLVIEQLSGKPYYGYVRDDYLSTMNLQNRIRPEYSRPDSCDAHNHKHGEGDISSLSTDDLPAPVPFEFEQYGVGLAAGGFRASAQDLAWVMTSLESRYAWDEIDSMGWMANSKGKLSHNGKLAGGTSVVQMFPEGYTAVGGTDLSGVKVALVTNIRTKDGSLGTLANLIALQVPTHEVEADYNLWRTALGSYSCVTVGTIGHLSR